MGKRAVPQPAAGRVDLKVVKQAKAKAKASSSATKKCKWCSRVKGSMTDSGVPVPWRGEDGLQCRSCPRIIARSQVLQGRAKTGLLTKDLEDEEYKQQWMEEVNEEEAEWMMKPKNEGVNRTVVASSITQGDSEQITGIFWPKATFKAEEGRDLTEEETTTCTKYGVVHIGCWRKRGIDALAIGAVVFRNRKGEQVSDSAKVADSETDGIEYTNAVSKAKRPGKALG